MQRENVIMDVQIELLQVLKNHTNDVTTCDFALGCLLASGSMDKTVRIWEWKTGLGYVEASFSPLKQHKYGITCVSFSPQGTMLASCSRDGNTILWNTRNGSQIYKFPQVNGGCVKICRFSTDSFILATAGDNGVVCVWDLIHRTLIRSFQHHDDTIESLSFTPDSMYLVTACIEGKLKLYSNSDIRDTTLEELTPLISVDDAHDLGVLCCDFCNTSESEFISNGIYLLATGGNDHCLRQWKIRCDHNEKNGNHSGEIESSFVLKEAHSSAVICLRYNNQGNILGTASLDKTLKLWSTEGHCLQLLDAHNRYVNCLAFSRDFSILCSGSNDKSLKIWDLTGGTLSIDSEIAKPCAVLSHFGCGDLKGISAVYEDSLVQKTQNDETEVVLKQVLEDVHVDCINAIEFNQDGLIVSASGDKKLRLLKESTDGVFLECENSPLQYHNYQINGITFISSSLLASCSLDGNIALWTVDQLNSKPLCTLSRTFAGVKCIRSDKKNHIVAAYDDGITVIWKTEPLKLLPDISYPEHANAATCCAFSPDGVLVCSASHDGVFRLYQMNEYNEYTDDEPIVMHEGHDLGVQSVDFSPKIEDVPIQYPDDAICHLLATCGNDGFGRIWKIIIPKEGDLRNRITCTEWRLLSGHGSSLTYIRFPPNRGDLVCTTSTDMQTRIWSVYSGHCLHVLQHSAIVASCSFSFDGKYLATGCLDGKLYIWTLPSLLTLDSNANNVSIWNTKNTIEWTTNDVVQWLNEIIEPKDSSILQQLIVKVHINNITGKHLVTVNEDEILDIFNIDFQDEEDTLKTLMEEWNWLQRTLLPITISHDDIPHHFLCPITHDIMKDPVKCSDGFTYERRAINEWFLSGGKYVSPMTNQTLYNCELSPNKELKKDIRRFICDSN